jgi:hypothetical protein
VPDNAPGGDVVRFAGVETYEYFPTCGVRAI